MTKNYYVTLERKGLHEVWKLYPKYNADGTVIPLDQIMKSEFYMEPLKDHTGKNIPVNLYSNNSVEFYKFYVPDWDSVVYEREYIIRTALQGTWSRANGKKFVYKNTILKLHQKNKGSMLNVGVSKNSSLL